MSDEFLFKDIPVPKRRRAPSKVTVSNILRNKHADLMASLIFACGGESLPAEMQHLARPLPKKHDPVELDKRCVEVAQALRAKRLEPSAYEPKPTSPVTVPAYEPKPTRPAPVLVGTGRYVYFYDDDPDEYRVIDTMREDETVCRCEYESHADTVCRALNR